MNEGRDRQLAALREHRKPGEEAALQHQGYRWLRGLAPLCSACILANDCPEYDVEQANRTCPIIERQSAAMLWQLQRLPQIAPEDAPLCEEYVRIYFFLTITDAWVSRIGLLVIDRKRHTVDVQPVLKARQSFANSLQRLSDRLGLNPAARAKLRPQDSLPPGVRAVLELEASDDPD